MCRYTEVISAGQSRDATERQRSAGQRAAEELRRVSRPYLLRREKSTVLAKPAEEPKKAAAAGAGAGAGRD